MSFASVRIIERVFAGAFVATAMHARGMKWRAQHAQGADFIATSFVIGTTKYGKSLRRDESMKRKGAPESNGKGSRRKQADQASINQSIRHRSSIDQAVSRMNRRGVWHELRACASIECRGREKRRACERMKKGLAARAFLGRKAGLQASLQVLLCIKRATKSVTLFLTVTLITALLIGWFQMVCFLHKFSLARVRPRSLRQFREYAHC